MYRIAPGISKDFSPGGQYKLLPAVELGRVALLLPAKVFPNLEIAFATNLI